MSQPSTSDFETAQTLRKQAFQLDHRLFQAYLAQSQITMDAVPSKTRWESEFAQLQRITRIWRKSNARCDRRLAIVYRFYL